MSYELKPSYQCMLLPATTLTVASAATAGSWFLNLDGYNRALVLLTVASKSLAGGGTVNLRVQYSPDNGTTADDIGSFTQITNGAVADGTYIMVLNQGTAGIADRVTTDATLAAASVRNQPWGDRMRVKYTPATFGANDTVIVTVRAWFFS